MRLVGLFLSMVLVAAAISCDDTAPVRRPGTGGNNGAGTGGTGAPVGTGGTTPPAGTGGTTGDAASAPDTAGSCKIPCLATLDTECAPAGTCVEQPTGPLGIGSNRCYSNGVKILSEIALAFPTTTMKITHHKADGSVCFTVEGTLQGTTMAQVTWKDPAGTAVATGTYNLTTMQSNIMCNGQSFDAQAALGCGATSNLPRAPGSPSSAGCTMGSCM